MDEIAAEAGTSKTVFYRHFTDRAGLYAAVAERVAHTIMRDITSATEGGVSAGSRAAGRAVVAAAIDAYLRLVEEEPQVYRFIVSAPLLETAPSDPSGPVSARIADRIAALFESELRSGGLRARVWAHGVVGMVRAAADDWLTRGLADSGVSRTELADLLTALAWTGLSSDWS